MTLPLADRFGLGDRELVSVVGAGGKSTILFTLASELSARGAKVVLTTTTMMAEGQVTPPVLRSAVPDAVDAASVPGGVLTIVAGSVPGKVTGPDPDDVDRIFTTTTVDYALVEADGARSNAVKAPGPYEPVIPSRSTTVIAVASSRAIGHTPDSVAHRPERVAALAGITTGTPLTVPAMSRLLLSRDGGLKNVPDRARLLFAITRVVPETAAHAEELGMLLERHPRVDGVVLVPEI